MDLYDPDMVSYSIFLGYYDFPRSTNKIPIFLHNFHISKKIVDLMEDLKYDHQSICPL